MIWPVGSFPIPVAAVLLGCLLAPVESAHPSLVGSGATNATVTIRFLSASAAPYPTVAGAVARYSSLALVAENGKPVTSGVKATCHVYYTKGWMRIQREQTVAATYGRASHSSYGKIRCSFRIPRSATGLWVAVNPGVSYKGKIASAARGVGDRRLGRAEISLGRR